MFLDTYLAMTAAEFAGCDQLPPRMAWMACHFSSYGTGLCNFPPAIAEGSMVIVNDRTPICGHNPELICQQLTQLCQKQSGCAVLLDFQRPDSPELQQLAQLLTRELSCPVGVSSIYAQGLDCPVFVPPPAPHHTLKQHLQSWQGREIWLEAATGYWEVTIDASGMSLEEVPPFPPNDPCFYEASVHSQYCIYCQEDLICFRMWRSRQELEDLLADAVELGAKRSIGLYQQLK